MKKQLVALASRANDLAIGPILVVIGLAALTIAIAVPFVEAFVLRLIGWDRKLSVCLRDAWIANVVSTCVGLACAQFFLDVGKLTAFVIMFCATVVTEGVIFSLLDGKRQKPVLLAALVPNVVTYGFLAFIWFVLL